jgi:hypothetical protein
LPDVTRDGASTAGNIEPRFGFGAIFRESFLKQVTQEKAMDSLHHVIRSIKGETRPRRDHLAVFREFISQLDRIGKRRERSGRKGGKPAARRAK